MKEKIKTRIGSKKESLPYVTDIGNADDQQNLMLPDGTAKAVRVFLNAATGEAIRNADGTVRYCCPWLLADIFSI